MKRFWTRPGTYKDVDFVLDRVSQITKQEMEDLGVNRWKAYGRARACKKAGTLLTIMDGMAPVAVYGAVKLDGQNAHATWFIASEAYFDAGAPAVLATAKFVRALKTKVKTDLRAATASAHKDAHRWFRLIGFELMYVQDEMYVLNYVGRPKVRGSARGDMPSDVCY